ncbi:hypothetical protein ACFTQ7_10310 [Lysinibacillus sp. NPDC056959]|uniref:hypothetical protein n=1 Tax=Lysinibacillus sp. NPDC056959 TaxID=3345981 RepID=UPI00362F5DEF
MIEVHTLNVIGDQVKTTFVALLGSVVLFVPLIVVIFIIGLQSGFGNFNLPSPVYAAYLDWRVDGKFEMMTLGKFLGQSLILLFTWFIVIINVVLFFCE